jgi:hypothetical protein
MCCVVAAQQTSLTSSPHGSTAVAESSFVVKPILPEVPAQHSFWSNENLVLFGGVAAASAADFTVTRANLQNGGKELDPVTRIFGRNSAGLAVNFAGETASIVGLSYFFHRTGHHKIEHFTAMINLGGSAAAVSYDLKHR